MAETCAVCGKYIGFWNLRYDACDITCARCCMVMALVETLGGKILPATDEPIRRKARERHARKLKKKDRTTLATA